MAKYNGNLEYLLEGIQHHVAPHKAALFALETGVIPEGVVANRNAVIFAEAGDALQQLAKIREAAQRGNATEVLRLLDEKFEFGIDS